MTHMLMQHLGRASLLLLATGLLLWLSVIAFLKLVGIGSLRDWVSRRNAASALVMAGFSIGLGLTLSGLFFGRHLEPSWEGVMRCWTEGLTSIPLLFLGIWINDRLVLRRIPIRREIHDDRNLGVALAVAGSCVLSGLTLNGALMGISPSWWHAIIDIMLYWTVAQLMVMVAVTAMDRCRAYDFQSLLEDEDNTAVGILLCGLFISIGLIARGSIVHAGGLPWGTDLWVSCVLALTGSILLLISRWIVSAIWFRQSAMDEIELTNNVAMAVVLSAGQVGLAMLISSAIQRPEF